MEMYQPCVVSSLTGNIVGYSYKIYTTYDGAANHYDKDKLDYRTNEVITLEVVK